MKGIIYEKRARAFLIKIILISVLFVLLGLLMCFFSTYCDNSYSAKNFPAYSDFEKRKVVIIDAGHGGIDGGAEVDGILEKDLNLKLANEIMKYLSLYDVDCVMTRRADTLLSTEGINGKKKSDLINRVKIADSYEDAVFVSIHMNKFPISKYHGLQVFYSPNNSMSEVLAEHIQSNVKKTLQSENNREIKKSGSSIYVLDRLDCPAILIECGFMSNPEELALLCDDTYLTELAFVISASIIQTII